MVGPADSPFTDTETGGALRLEPLSIDGSQYAMLRWISYGDPEHEEPFTVPADLAHFRRDLASVPSIFTWLVPDLHRFSAPVRRDLTL